MLLSLTQSYTATWWSGDIVAMVAASNEKFPLSSPQDANNLFPLPHNHFSIPPYRKCKSHRARSRLLKRRGIGRAANNMVRWLNWLAGGAASYEESPSGVRDAGAAGPAHERPSSPQLALLHAVWESCQSAWCRGVFKREPAPTPASFAYYTKRKVFQYLRVEDIALPSDGVAATVDLLQLLPQHIRTHFNNEGIALLVGSTEAERAAAMAEARSTRYAWGFENDGEYARVLRRAIEVGMVDLDFRPALVTNGLFGVPKPAPGNPDQLRLITDARPQNKTQQMPWKLELPNPSTFANLIIEPGSQIHIAKSDVDSMFHRVRVPNFIAERQGLPPVTARALGIESIRIWDVNWQPSTGLTRLARAGAWGPNIPFAHSRAWSEGVIGEFEFSDMGRTQSGGAIASVEGWVASDPGSGDVRLYPRVKSMLMGWTGSVHCAQAMFEKVVTSVGLPPGQSDYLLLRGPKPYWLGPDEVAQLVYVDDYIGLGTDAVRVDQHHQRVRQEMNAVGLVESEKKTVLATDDGVVNALGSELSKDGQFGPDRVGLRSLIGLTRELLRAKYVAGDYLRSVLGQWTWVALCNRPFLSIFENAYRYARYYGASPGRLWDTARDELECAIALSPWLWVRLDSQFSARVYATDASTGGGGTVYTQANSAREVYQLVREAAGVVGNRESATAVHEFTRAHRWAWATSHTWRHREHINALEFAEVLVGLRHALRSPANWGQRIACLVDSTVVTYSLAKGRSSSHRLNKLARRAAALLLPTRTRLWPLWVPTKSNPADAPSRWASKLAHKAAPSRSKLARMRTPAMGG